MRKKSTWTNFAEARAQRRSANGTHAARFQQEIAEENRVGVCWLCCLCYLLLSLITMPFVPMRRLSFPASCSTLTVSASQTNVISQTNSTPRNYLILLIHCRLCRSAISNSSAKSQIATAFQRRRTGGEFPNRPSVRLSHISKSSWGLY